MTAPYSRSIWCFLAIGLFNSACGNAQQHPGSDDMNEGGAGAGAGTPSMGGTTPGGSTQGGAGTGGEVTMAGQGDGGPAPAKVEPFQIAATLDGTCGLARDGTIHCWGLEPAVWQVPEGQFVELHGGTDAVICAVRADRSVACFAEPMGLPDITRQPTFGVHLLALSEGALCGTDTNDVPFCNPTNQQYGLAPPKTAVAAVSVGNQFACFVGLNDGQLSCVGAATLGNCTYSPPFKQLDAPTGSYVDLTSGADHSCAVSTEGKLACWGIGKTGDTAGQPCFYENSAGQSEPPDGTFKSVWAGMHHACAIRTDGTVACWGKGTLDACDEAGCRQSRPPAGAFDQLALGLFHSCGMKPDRSIECWGFDGHGTLNPPAELRP